MHVYQMQEQHVSRPSAKLKVVRGEVIPSAFGETDCVFR